MFAANYPLAEEEFERGELPTVVNRYRNKAYGLTIAPRRLQQIRSERRPDSRYASPQQVSYEVREAEALFRRHGIPNLDTSECSIEEIASIILDQTGIERRTRP